MGNWTKQPRNGNVAILLEHGRCRMEQNYVSSKSGKDPEWAQRTQQDSGAFLVSAHEEVQAAEEDQFLALYFLQAEMPAP